MPHRHDFGGGYKRVGVSLRARPRCGTHSAMTAPILTDEDVAAAFPHRARHQT